MLEKELDLEKLALEVGRVITRRFQQIVAVKAGKVIKQWNRHYVVRFRLNTSSETELPNSVIVKQTKIKGDTWYNEWAGLEFLSNLSSNHQFSPRFLGGDATEGFVVMEDLGAGRLLEDYLNDADPTSAITALKDLAIVTAQMQIASLGRESEYTIIREKLLSESLSQRAKEAQNYLGWLPEIKVLLEAVGVKITPQFEMEYREVAHLMINPGPFLTYTHGDMAPSNNYYNEAGVRLLDFEYGSYRHALYDATSWQIICPYPEPAIKIINQVYREELVKGIPEAGDDALFYHGLVAMCMVALARDLKFILPKVLDKDGEWVAGMTARQAIIYKLNIFTQTIEEWKQLTGLAEVMQELRLILLTKWPAEVNQTKQWSVFQR